MTKVNHEAGLVGFVIGYITSLKFQINYSDTKYD